MSAADGRRRESRTGSLTLSRGLDVLDVLSHHPGGLTVAELAAELAAHRASVYRLISTLEDRRLVSRGVDGRYALGTGLIELASRVRPRLIETAMPEMQKLADQVHATTGLTLRTGRDEAMVAAVAEPRNADSHLAYRSGLKHSLEGVASGMAILAGNPPVEGEGEEVAAARERGWATSLGTKWIPGAHGVAAPVRDGGRTVEAAVGALFLGERDKAAIGALVVVAAEAISARLS